MKKTDSAGPLQVADQPPDGTSRMNALDRVEGHVTCGCSFGRAHHAGRDHDHQASRGDRAKFQIFEIRGVGKW